MGAMMLEGVGKGFVLISQRPSLDLRPGAPHEGSNDDDDSDAGVAGGKTKEKAHAKWAHALDELLAVLNNMSVHQRLVHWCSNPCCCKGYCLAGTRHRASHTIACFILRVVPVVPSAGNWTKSGPALDIVLGGLWCHGIWGALTRFAFGAKAKGHLKGMSLMQEHDVHYVEEIAWQEVAGVRLAKTLKFLGGDTLEILTSIAVVREPLRFITSGFLRSGRAVRRPDSPPSLFEWMIPKLSRVFVALQYFANFLEGRGSRWALVLQANKCASHRDFLAQRYEVACNLTRGLCLAASWAHRRNNFLPQWPWPLCLIADGRTGEAERSQTAHHLFTTPSCCLDALFARKLRGLLTRPEELTTEYWVTFLQA